MPSTVPSCQASGWMSNASALQLDYRFPAPWRTLVLACAGLELYPE